MRVPALKEVRYDPARFLDVESLEDAIEVILTPEEGMSSRRRWREETPILMEFLLEKHIAPDSVVLDYGCGAGRIAKPLIEKLRCSVVGVDMSANMRALAASCVDSNQFFAISEEMLTYLRTGIFDTVIAIWALQHCLHLEPAIKNIYWALKPGGKLVLVNNHKRYIPIPGGNWANDGLDVHTMLQDAGLKCVEGKNKLPESIAPKDMQNYTFWAIYQKV